MHRGEIFMCKGYNRIDSVIKGFFKLPFFYNELKNHNFS